MAPVTTFRGRPFPHWLVDNLLPPDMCYSITGAMSACREQWRSRPDDYEPGKFEVPVGSPFRDEVAIRAVAWARQHLPLNDIDKLWHGAGAQAMVAGGRLEPHLDHTHTADGTPIAYKAVVFVHPRWRTTWGGELELWWTADANPIPVAIHPARRYSPKPGRMVVMANCRLSAHGVASISEQAVIPRFSMLLNFVGPEPDFPRRPRALFLPKFGDTEGNIQERLERAGLSGTARI